MSTKNNALVALAAAALGVVVKEGASPICEGLLNDMKVTQFGASEVDAAGRVLVIVSVEMSGVDVVRPVADQQGNVKLFGDANAGMTLSKRANLSLGVIAKFVKFNKAATVGDPINALKAKYKRFKSEAANAVKQGALMASKVSAALALGWNTAVGTPEHDEYNDLAARVASIGEWQAFNATQVVALAASLTAAGIDPLTVV